MGHYIFVHGLGQTSEKFEKIVEEIEIKNMSCPNLKELFGDEEVIYKNLYKNFRRYCDNFSESLHLCGHSLGGVLSLQYTIENPEKVQTLVLIGTQYKMPKMILSLQAVIFRCLPKTAFEKIGFSKNEFITLTSSMRELDFTEKLTDIICETLVLCGEKDTFNRRASEELGKRLKNVRIEWLEQGGHEIDDENSEEISFYLQKFWNQEMI